MYYIRCQFGIVIYDEYEFAFCLADTPVISSGEPEVFTAQEKPGIRIVCRIENGSGIDDGCHITNQDLEILVTQRSA